MKSPELKLFRAVITKAIEDSIYEGQDRYKIMDNLEILNYLRFILFYIEI